MQDVEDEQTTDSQDPIKYLLDFNQRELTISRPICAALLDPLWNLQQATKENIQKAVQRQLSGRFLQLVARS
jgi:hypothetical protein